MKILLDTHIFIWWDSDPDRLSPSARAMCQDEKNTLILSAASVWEMQIKGRLGKLELRLPLTQLIESQQKTNSVEILPITLDHVLALESLPTHHKDPFDHLLMAQAKSEDIYLLSADSIFDQYELNLLR